MSFSYVQWEYSIPPLIGTPLLPKNSVVIREMFFGERQDYMQSQTHSTCYQKNVPFIKGCPFQRVSFKRGTTVLHILA